jgi:DNA-binding response OmpR family regulator
MFKVLIVEDDIQISRSLSMNLKLSGFEVEAASRVSEGWAMVQKNHYDILLLDIGLPDGSGLELCQRIRESGDDVPILFLSARTDETTVVKGIQLGADDYIRKPFGTEELKARMNKLLKKSAQLEKMFLFNKLSIDIPNREISVGDKSVNLGKKELEILLILARRAGDLVTRETILSTMEEGINGSDRTIDSHMSHLRKKLKEVGGESLQITSIYGEGYKLVWVPE